MKAIKQSGKALLTIINDILDYSKLNEGKLQFETLPFRLDQLIENITLPYTMKKSDTVTFSSEIAQGINNNLIGDPNRLKQILDNLLNNAFKFTAHGSVILKISEVDNNGNHTTLRFDVIDSGIGISQETQARIFNQFEQADSSTTRLYGGTGLGLSICKKLVESVNGEIFLQSELHQGSTFSVKLPYTINHSCQPEQEKPDTDTDLSKLNILLVEDNPINQKVAAAMLKRLSCDYTLANNGQEAIDIICRHDSHYDLILMDCEMPIMDGYEATQKIRQWEKQQQRLAIKIIALTAHALQEHIQRCHQVGMDNHLAKPLQLKALKDSLSSSIDSSVDNKPPTIAAG